VVFLRPAAVREAAFLVVFFLEAGFFFVFLATAAL
jgi:hypothetical protein